MKTKNFEFKARVRELAEFENKLLALKPKYIGSDHQIDTYFNVSKGRLKLREGNIENALIHYDRADLSSAKLSEILLYQHAPDATLKQILVHQLGIKVVVDKERKIYFIDNVKFHFDTVKGLGTFIEVEAIDDSNAFATETLQKLCEYYFQFFGLNKEDLVGRSYSDLMLEEGS